MTKVKMRLLAFVLAAIGLGIAASPASAMHCYINGQPDLTDVCNRIIGVVCNPKVGPCG